MTERYNRTRQDVLGALSPEQVHALIKPGWLLETIALNDHVTLSEVAGADLVVDARLVLGAVQRAGVVRTTVTHSFPRAFVERIFPHITIEPRLRDYLMRHRKVVGQQDVPRLGLLQALLRATGLLLLRRGQLTVTRRGARLLAEQSAGELCALLFRNLFGKIDLASLDGLPPAPALQTCIGFSIYQVDALAADWTEISEVSWQLFLPSVAEDLPLAPWEGQLAGWAELRVLRYLAMFGVVELGNSGKWERPERFRKAPLFDQFIRFLLPPAMD